MTFTGTGEVSTTTTTIAFGGVPRAAGRPGRAQRVDADVDRRSA